MMIVLVITCFLCFKTTELIFRYPMIQTLAVKAQEFGGIFPFLIFCKSLSFTICVHLGTPWFDG